MPPENAEGQRLAEAAAGNVRWDRWGPYLSERQWGTVREDYSADGDAWGSFPHDMARSRAYRWGEDGLLGICDDGAVLCFALALWNGADPILKERPFGLTNPEGNHGEDIKEYYYFLANTPTHSYMKALYKYPQRAFPYEDLVEVNGRRSREEPEYELLDTGAFADNRYFDVTVERQAATSRAAGSILRGKGLGGERAKIVGSAKGFNSTGSKLTDAVREIVEMAEVRRPNQFVFAFIDGLGWLRREKDLGRIYQLWSRDEIDGLYSLARMEEFRVDLRDAALRLGLLGDA
jgi:hypothetical protein